MKLILFLGAGVSVPSHLPTVVPLTQSLFRKAYHQDRPSHFSRGWHPDPTRRTTDITIRIRGLLRLLRAHDGRDIRRVGIHKRGGRFRSSGAIHRDETTYEDLFFLCQQIKLWNIGLADNSLVTPFMESIERRGDGLLRGRSFKARMNDLAMLADQACNFIESAVAGSLNAKTIRGFNLVLQLAKLPGVERLNIVTLNHDTLVERFLSAEGISYADGFSACDGNLRWYDENSIGSCRPKIRILKLHGSISWYAFGSPRGPRLGCFLGENVADAKNALGETLVPTSPGPSFLTGVNKAVHYQRGIYADLHFCFHQILHECGSMLMSGYGWGDTAINFKLDAWLDQPKTMILLHENPVAELTDKSLIMASGYDHWVRSGKLILIPKWLKDTCLKDVKHHLK